ncbi:MAG: ABC transporter ATP-binding protein [bacterium]
MQSFWRLLAFVKPYKRALILAFLCALLYAFFNAIAIWFSASFITAIFSPETQQSALQVPGTVEDLNQTLKALAWNLIGSGDRFDIIKRVCLIFFLAFVLRNVFNVGQLYFISYIEQKVIKKLRDALYQHILSQSFNFFLKRKSGDLASTILNDISLLNDKMMKAIKFSMSEPFLIIIALVLMFVISFKLALAALVLLPLAGILISRLGKSLKRKSSRMQEALASVTSLLYERLIGIRLIKITGTEIEETQRFQTVTTDHFRRALRQRRFDFLTVPLTEVLGLGIISLILLLGGYLVFQTNVMDAEDFVRFLAILFSILAPIKTLGDAYNSAQVASAVGDRIFHLLDTQEKLPVITDPKPVSDFKTAIQFEQVGFRYENAEQDALSDINLTISKGKTVAFVGPSGAGKTTLIGLIIRLFDPSSGCVRLDGVDLREQDLKDLRQQFGMVSQDIVLFNDTIAANIAYGGAQVDSEKIHEAARLANADEFINALPDGYNTLIGDRGARLSGGQQQRLSIARALVHDPSVIIFDEATSHLDSESEALIQKSLQTLRRDRTVILIAHRLTTVRQSDCIVVLDQGKIVDQGTYDELLKRCALFKRLCKQQLLQ